MEKNDNHSELLRRAVVAAGGEGLLCRYLEVRREQVDRWLAGRAPVPPRLFLRLVDLLSEREAAQAFPGRWPPSN